MKILTALYIFLSLIWNCGTVKLDSLNPSVYSLGLRAYSRAKQEYPNLNPTLTIIDFSVPSSQVRLFVIDLNKNHIIFQSRVTHGIGSGQLYATEFSNQFDSHKSSLGSYITLNTYNGKHGISLKVKGLDMGFNNNAYARSIVFHGAPYATNSYLQQHGQLGHSYGCFATAPYLNTKLISLIKNNTFVFVYYPDSYWLSHSRYLN